MEEKRTRRNTVLFVAFFLLAGLIYMLSRSGIAVLEAACTGCNYLIYAGLLLFWLQSVRTRLLPSRTKTWMICAALLLLFYQVLRVLMYRCATEPAAIRYLSYLFFTPMTLVPTLLLMTCLRIRRGNRPGRPDEALLLIFPIIRSTSGSAESRRLMPIVIVRTSKFSCSIILFVSRTSEILIIDSP